MVPVSKGPHKGWRGSVATIGALWLTGVAALSQPSGSELLEAARQLHRNGELAEAAEVYRESLSSLEREDNLEGLATALNGLSLAEIHLGQYQDAVSLAERSVSIRRQLEDLSGEAASTVNLGLAHYYLGNYPQSLKHYRRSLELDTQLGDRESQVLDLNNIGNVYFLQADYWNALTSYQRALKIVAEDAGQPWASYEEQSTRANLAALLQKLGEPRDQWFEKRA